MSFTSAIVREHETHGFTISFEDLRVLTNAISHFPPRVPMRWDLVAKLVSDAPSTCSEGLESYRPRINLGVCVGTSREFRPTSQDCSEAFTLLSNSHPAIFKLTDTLLSEPLYREPSRRDALKPLVHLPPVKTCCDQPVVIRNRPFPLVYTTCGTVFAACFVAECRSTEACKNIT